MTIEDLQTYIDSVWNGVHAGDIEGNKDVTDYDMKLSLLTSINDISLQRIFDNYGDKSLDFLSRYLGGTIVPSRFKVSEAQVYDVVYGAEVGRDVHFTHNENVGDMFQPYKKDMLQDVQLDTSVDTSTDGVRTFNK